MNPIVVINGMLLGGRFSGIHHSMEQMLLQLDRACGRTDVDGGEICREAGIGSDEACRDAGIDSGEICSDGGGYNGVQSSTIGNDWQGMTIKAVLPGGYSGRLDHMRHLEVHKIGEWVPGTIGRLLSENTRLVGFARLQRAAVFHGPAAALPLINTAAKKIITIHDLAAFDLPGLCQRRTVAYHRLLLPYSIRKADHIIAVSHTVKNRIMELFGIHDSKIKVIYHGIDPRFVRVKDEAALSSVRCRYKLPEKYILYVGNLESKKNIPCLIKAFRQFRAGGNPEYTLVLAGRKGWGYGAIRKTAEGMAVGDLQEGNPQAGDAAAGDPEAVGPQAGKKSPDILFTGYVADEHLAALYSMADVAVLPSLYEGFGIPPLEAMACGTPVIVSDRGSLPEITGYAGIKVGAGDAGMLADAMKEIVHRQDLRDMQVRQGLMRAGEFTWQRSVKDVIGLYRDAVSG